MSNIVCNSYLRYNSPRNEKPLSFTHPHIMTSFPPWNIKGKALKNILEWHSNKGELELHQFNGVILHDVFRREI